MIDFRVNDAETDVAAASLTCPVCLGPFIEHVGQDVEEFYRMASSRSAQRQLNTSSSLQNSVASQVLDNAGDGSDHHAADFTTVDSTYVGDTDGSDIVNPDDGDDDEEDGGDNDEPEPAAPTVPNFSGILTAIANSLILQSLFPRLGLTQQLLENEDLSGLLHHILMNEVSHGPSDAPISEAALVKFAEVCVLASQEEVNSRCGHTTSTSGVGDDIDSTSAVASICPISQEPFEVGDEILVLRCCSHAFKREHIMQWLNSHATCPVCRTALLA
jgi:hypothetical protein